MDNNSSVPSPDKSPTDLTNPVPLHNNSKWHKGLIAVVVLAIIAIAAVYLNSLRSNPNPTPQTISPLSPQTSNDTATPTPLAKAQGNTFVNQKYGYETTIPTDWELLKPFDGNQNKDFDDDVWLVEKGEPELGRGEIYIEVKANTEHKTLQDFATNKKEAYYSPDKKLTVGGEQAIQLRLVMPAEPPFQMEAGWIGGLLKSTYVIHDGKVYLIEGVGEDTAAVEKKYDEVIENFKFISPGSGNFRYLPIGERLEWTENTVWNFDAPKTFVTYSNLNKNFSFQVPYNEKWGTSEIKLKPYEETKDGKVYFGNVTIGCEGGCSMSRDAHVYTVDYQSAQSLIADLNNDEKYWEGGFRVKPTLVNLDSLQAVEYEYGELGFKKFVIVIGKKFNYIFSAGNVEIKDLEQVAKTIQFN